MEFQWSGENSRMLRASVKQHVATGVGHLSWNSGSA